MESDYKQYKPDTRVKVKSTEEYGDAFESTLGFISVFIDGHDKCQYYKLDNIEFF